MCRATLVGLPTLIFASLLSGLAIAQQDPQRLVICVDPLNLPYSAEGADPPGFDVEIGAMLARELKRSFSIFWADTGTRGGLTRALRRSIAAGQCDAFMGIPRAPGVIEELEDMGLVLTRAYMTVGLVLVQPSGAQPIARFDQLSGITTAVQMGTMPHGLLLAQKFPAKLFRSTDEALAALDAKEAQAAFLFGPIVGWSIRQKYGGRMSVTADFQLQPDWQWDLAIAVRKADVEMRTQLDEASGRLLADNRIATVLARYGVAFKPPQSH